MWVGMARTWRLRAAPTAAGGACVTGVIAVGREQGKVVRARRSGDATDRRGQGTSGARCQWRGAGGRERSGAARRQGADMRAWPAQCRVAWFKLALKPVQNYPNGSNEIRIPPNFG
jgi:hypothetical protein